MIASILLQLILLPVLLAAFAIAPQLAQPNHRPAQAIVRVNRKKQQSTRYVLQSKPAESAYNDGKSLLIM